MPRETVDVIRELFSALDRNDLAAALDAFHPDVEWSPTEGSYQGIAGVGEAFIEWLEPWDEHRIEPEEFVADADQVLVTIHITARGEHSGMEIDQRFFQLYTVRDEKIRRMVEYVDREQAVRA